MTAPARLTETEANVHAALRNIREAARTLKAHLESVKRDVDKAIADMEAGKGVAGSHSFGPIGHQAPFDITVANTKLQAAFTAAVQLGISNDDIQSAYNEGTK